jgi:hypothetical protein
MLVDKYGNVFCGINRNSISLVCQGKRKTAGGYVWKFKTEEVDNDRF